MPLWGIAILTEVTHGNFIFTLVLEGARDPRARRQGVTVTLGSERGRSWGMGRTAGHTSVSRLSRLSREAHDRFAKLALKLATLTYYTYAKTDRVRYSPASAHISYSQPYYTSRTVLVLILN